jgi:hypothetical protein
VAVFNRYGSLFLQYFSSYVIRAGNRSVAERAREPGHSLLRRKPITEPFSGCQFQWILLLAEVDFASKRQIFKRDLDWPWIWCTTIVGHHLTAHFSGGCMVATAPSTSTARDLYVVLEATPPEFQGLFSKFQEVADQAAIMPPAKHKIMHYAVTQRPSMKACSASWMQLS